MSEISHLLYVYNSVGVLLDIITESRLVALAYGLSENEPGVLEFSVQRDEEAYLFLRDNVIEVYQIIDGVARLEGETAFFIRRSVLSTAENGSKVRAVQAYSALEILSRHLVAYPAGSSYSEKYAKPWDDTLREVVYENFGSGASYAGYPDRNVEPWLVVESDQSVGASYPRSIAWRYVLDALQDLVSEVRARGTYATFDVVRTGVLRFEFRVYLGARGIDHTRLSPTPVIVSEEFHNLVSGSLDEDWTEERNYIYAAGQGQEEDRVIKEAWDTERIQIGPFGRREYLADARQVSSSDGVQSEAYSALESLRPRKVFSGSIAQTESCVYGIHWTWGDIVTAQFEGSVFDCHVTTVVVKKKEDGSYTVTGNLRSVSDV